ncbi:RidA family protein [Erwinia sp. 198]|uniref:RidA family protein n=1 Tax=Erwinia sp. 198 TaxID=2022746 RepID=UPI000F691C3B|nr:RidA family protein [Erwinia sp. 198]RRZ88921.1 RidA family protein [Erwinia sp. 198]
MHQAIVFHPGTLPFPFSRATEVGGILYLSGQVAVTEKAEPLYGDITSQTRHILSAIEATLASLDVGLDAIFKVNVWLSDMQHFAEFNREYARWFNAAFPARSVVSSKLAFDLDVEIEVQAVSADAHFR